VRAFARDRPTAHPDVKLVLVGELWPGGRVRPLVQELGLRDRVVFAGSPGGGSPGSRIPRADLFVLTSRQEGLGIVILEAQASGTPPVIMRCGGGDELIRDGEDGWVLEAGDEAGFADRLDALLKDPQARHRAAERAVSRVRSESSLNTFTDALGQAYARVWPEVRLAHQPG
jgi:glycosyltransferase involved in cell wall biosynthesis